MPSAVDSFLGRDEDVARIGELFERARLVTVTGGPGMGKTRLATELTRNLASAYPDGTWLVALAPLSDSDLVAGAVAAAVGASDQTAHQPLQAIASRVRERRALLLLDNCEHVLDACARLAAALVESCPNLHILATSQERLGVNGEQVWPISGLATPDPISSGDGRNQPNIETVGQSPAVALFVERAKSASPTFALEPDNVSAVADVCRRLDGIPLAIELAAARVGTFTPTEIVAHLERRFAFLTSGSRAALPRHQTLRAAVDWSYDLLDEPDQALLRRLSIFSGGAILDAIETVCAGDGVDPDECVELMGNLVGRSLVVPIATAAGTRYGMLETIRFYGRDRLGEAGELTAIAGRHLRWCIDLAEQAEPHLVGAGQKTWLARLDADHDNLRAAMAWSLDQGPTDEALHLAGHLTMFWLARGHFGEGFGWLDRALAVNEDADVFLLAKGYWGKAMMAAMLGRWEVTSAAAQASLELSASGGDAAGAGRASLLLAQPRLVQCQAQSRAAVHHRVSLAGSEHRRLPARPDHE